MSDRNSTVKVDDDDALGIAEPPKIFLRRKMQFSIEDENGGRLSMTVTGLSPEDAVFSEGGALNVKFQNVWESLKGTHASLISGRPPNDYAWSNVSFRDDDD